MTPHFDPRRDVELRRALEAIERSAPQAVGLDAARFAAAPTRRTSPVKVIAVAVAVVAAAALPIVFLGRDAADEAPGIGGPGVETSPGQSEETPGSRDDHLGPIVGTNLEGLPIDHVIPVADGFLGLSWGWGDEPLLVGWSPDGREWEPRGVVTDGPSSPVHLHGSFEIDGTVLLIGWRDPIGPDPDASERLPRSAHAWQSADGGFTWTETVTEIGGPGTRALAVAATPLGLVLVGVVPGVISGPDVYDDHAAVWMSDDGTNWRRVWSSDDPEGVSSGAWSVVWWQGEIMVFGGRGEPRMGEHMAPDRPEPWEPVVWTSSDGLTWSEPRQTTEVGGLVVGAVATSRGLTALIDQSLAGPVPLKHAVAVGTSPNGVTWTIEPIGGANFDAVGPVVVDSRGVVAVGMPPSEANPSPGWTQLEIWAQTDAGRWVHVDVPGLPSEPAHITRIVGGPDRILILGWVAAPWPGAGEYFAISIPLTEWETLVARAG